MSNNRENNKSETSEHASKYSEDPVIEPVTVESKDIENSDYYQNREISWLDFNARVIAEAEDDTNPLLEQLTFLAIGSSNLDEFVRVRVAGLQDQVKFGSNERDNKKYWSADKQLEEISNKNAANVVYQYDLYHQKMQEVKDAFHFEHRRVSELDNQELEELNRIFEEKIKPAITPFGIDAYRPFPSLDNEAVHLFVRLEKEDSPYVATIPIPKQIARFHVVKGNSSDNKTVVFTEDIIQHYLDELFIGFEVKYSFYFRISRNADLEIHEEGAEDLLSAIENYLDRRKNGVAVRLEVDIRKASTQVVKDVAFLVQELELDERDVYGIKGPLDLTYLMDLQDVIEEDYPDAGYPPHQPLYPTILKGRSLYEVMEEQDILLHHPFESFDPVIDLVANAVNDKDTIAIKQTLYRVSSSSPLIKNLKNAAKRGIQVTVLVELKARFDEENNVHWAKELEEAGVHILYGMKELKTHSKATLVVQKKNDEFKRYVHLGTGNYNEKTARGYTDLGLLTAHEEIVEDVAEFFNYLSGYSERPDYKHLHVSPNELRQTFLNEIDEEINYHRQHDNGHIVAKMNSLTDKEYIMKLLEASQAGVKIELIIRGICCLIPGIPGLSETITVRSIVGRFLEHTRIYYFHNNGDEKVYLASADMMTRNLSRRVEIAFPLLDSDLRTRVINIMRLYLTDNYKAWELNSKSEYVKQRPAEDEEPISAQETLLAKTEVKNMEQRVVEKKNWVARLTEKILQSRN